jgi:peroxiredoxin
MQIFLRTAIFICIQFVFLLKTTAQAPENSEYAEIGKPMPYFSLSKIYYFSKDHATLNDFKGKWLVLDFFSVGCLSCFASFPHTDSVYQKYKDKVQFMLLGWDNNYIRPVFAKFSARNHLHLPVYYDPEGHLAKRFGANSVPHIIVIDSKGIVRAIVDKITSENIASFLAGNDPHLQRKLYNWEFESLGKNYDASKPLLINGNGGDDTTFLFRSVLARSVTGFQNIGPNFIKSRYFGNRIQMFGATVLGLYNMAYGDTNFRFLPDPRGHAYGNYALNPLLEVTDSSDFETEVYSPKNLYNYSLIVPKARANTVFLQKVMRNDLDNFFGYNVQVETRLLPAYKIVLVDSILASRLKSRGGTPDEWGFPSTNGVKIINHPITRMILALALYHQKDPPIIDETGIQYNVDLNLVADVYDFEDISKGLQKLGLDLVKYDKPMKVVVIRDKEK